MNFLVVGLSHKTAPVEVREQMAVPEGALGEALAALVAHPGVNEAMILSTCNRVELVVRTEPGADAVGVPDRSRAAVIGASAACRRCSSDETQAA